MLFGMHMCSKIVQMLTQCAAVHNKGQMQQPQRRAVACIVIDFLFSVVLF